MQRNILQYLEQTIKMSPYKVAFTDGTDSMTFREVYDQARAIGSTLSQFNIYGQGVAVFMTRHPRMITTFLGVLYGGNYYIPLDVQMPRSRLEMILKTAKPKVMICDKKTKALGIQLADSCKVVLYSDIAFGIIQEDVLRDIRRKQIDLDPAYVVFTSGSTGIPKGIVGSHRAVIDYIDQLCDVMEFNDTTVFGNQTPLYFDACLKEILPALKYGGTVHLIPKALFLFPVKLVEYLNGHKINTLCWVSSALTMISSMNTFETMIPENIHTVAFASEVFPVKQLKLWQQALPKARFFNLYGPTETTGICCYYKVDRTFEDQEPIPIGQPFPNTRILLLNEQGQIVPEGEAGEICILGSRLTLGYYGQQERTSACFVQNPLNAIYPERMYRTGDLAKYNSRGELVFLSRKDHQIKHMGHRIELGEIEAAASQCENLQISCCVFDEDRKKIVLYYTGTIEPQDLAGFLKARLPRYMLPNLVYRLDTMPMTPNGKIDRVYLKCILSPSESGKGE